MNQRLAPYRSVADAVARLFHPHVEVVVHDASNGRIAYIANAFSKRRAGDDSLIVDDPAMSDEAMNVPYAKTNWNGGRLRSITTPLTDVDGRAIGHFCINYDIEALTRAQEALLALVSPPPIDRQPKQLFAIDWREDVNVLVADFLQERGLGKAGLNALEVEELLRVLSARGVFEIRSAPSYVAEVLGVSRATLYAKLKRARIPGAANATSIDPSGVSL